MTNLEMMKRTKTSIADKNSALGGIISTLESVVEPSSPIKAIKLKKKKKTSGDEVS